MRSCPVPSERPSTKVSPDEEDRTDDVPIINEEEVKDKIIDAYLDLKTEDVENLKRVILRLEDFESTTNNDLEELGLDAFSRKRVLIYCQWLNHIISEKPDFTIELNPEQSYLFLSPVALQGWGRRFITTNSVATVNEPFVKLGKANVSGLMTAQSTSSEIAESEFAIKFKGLSSAPTFNGKIKNFNTFNRKLTTFHQANMILHRAEPSINDIVCKRSSRNDQRETRLPNLMWDQRVVTIMRAKPTKRRIKPKSRAGTAKKKAMSRRIASNT